MSDAQLTLPDGRRLGYSILGNSRAPAVFYLHGIPGSRREPQLPQSLAQHLCLIAPDRPGYGDSSPCSDYSFEQCARDLAVLADALEIDRFGLFGFSAGGVFALACARALGQRVTRLVLAGTPANALMEDPVAQAGELTGSVWRQAQRNPRELAENLRALTGSSKVLNDAMLGALGDSDLALLAAPAIARHYQRSLAHAVVGGERVAAAAMAREIALLVSDWGFDPGQVTQPVALFHGARDKLLTVRHAQALVQTLARAELTLDPHAGHYACLYGVQAASLWRYGAGGN